MTTADVVTRMYREIHANSGTDPYDLIDSAYRAATAALGENEFDTRVETAERVAPVAEAAIEAILAAAGEPADYDGTPTSLATIDQARTVMARVTDLPVLRSVQLPIDN